VKPLPRGLVAAVGASIALHLAAVTVPWRGMQSGASRPAAAATLVARLIELPPAGPPVEEHPNPAVSAPEVLVAATAVPAMLTEPSEAPPAAASVLAPVPEARSRPLSIPAPVLPESVTAPAQESPSLLRGAAESRARASTAAPSRWTPSTLHFRLRPVPAAAP
jgi:hypothetical protein